MHKKHNTSLLLTFKPSSRLKYLLVFVHIMALLAGIGNALPLMVKISLCILIGMHFWMIVRYLKVSNYSISYSEALGWRFSEGGNFASISILKSTVATTLGLVLHIKYQDQLQHLFWLSDHKKTLLILSDALSEKDYRSLIVKLRTCAIK